MNHIPIPPATPEQQVELAALVDRILAATKVGQAFLPAQEAQTRMSALPSSDIAVLEAEVDRLVYRLYGLTPDEIAIVEGREAGGKKAAAATKPVKAAAGAKKPRKSVLTEDPDLA